MYPSLKPSQAEAIHSLLVGKDTLCVHPTGSGKSAIFVLAPLMKAKVVMKGSNEMFVITE